MRFDHITLRNFKPYGDAELSLDPGVTVIHGLNGSGKSSLLEACFFALYGSKALDGTLEDVVTNGEEESEVTLSFTHGDQSYRIEREVKVRDERAVTTRCVLETPDGTIDGARDVRRYIAELLRMDEEAFVNCAYVRQGEVNKLIHASPTERQDMIDDLLQLGKLEDYRERAREARLGIEDVLGNVEGSLQQVESQIEAKEEKDLHGRLNELESERSEVEADIERFEDNRDKAKTTLENFRQVLDTHQEKREELETLREEIQELQSKIEATERERDGLRDRIGEARERIDELEDKRESLLAESELPAEADAGAVEVRIEELDAEADELSAGLSDLRVEHNELDNRAKALAEQADDLQSRAERKREEAQNLESAVEEDAGKLGSRREKLAELDEEIEAQKARFEDAPVAFGEAESLLTELKGERDDLREREGELEVELKTTREEVERAEELLAEGKCPECGQPVEDSPHVDGLDESRERVAELESELEELGERRETLLDRLERARGLVEAESEVAQLESNRENVRALVEEREETIEERRETAETRYEEADELETEAEAKRAETEAKRAEAEEVAERIERLEDERETIEERSERLERIADLDDELAELADDIEDMRERRESKAELNDERRERLREKRERRDELSEEYDESTVEEARGEVERAENYLQKVEPKLEELRERRDELVDRIGRTRGELENLERLRDRREEIGSRVDALETLHGEASELEAMYGDLRAELRGRNVATLERMLNETFELVYQNDAYARIELDGDYELTVYQKDGQPLEPDQLSGGERALFNLSLRCAIYRLLAEGIEGAAPMPPLILDEPTVFLDSGHVTQLVELVESMRDLGVEQIIVVSHDEELVGAADDLVQVQKDSTTNRSMVERAEELQMLPGD